VEQQDLPARRFTKEELGEVIELATRLEQSRRPTDDPGVSLQDLRTIAAELGISDAALLEAVAAQLEARDEVKARLDTQAKRDARWREMVRAWKLHLAVYLSTMAGLFVIDVSSDGAIDFVMYPAAAWGIAILIHGATVWTDRPSGSSTGS
jgi:2TM domain